MDIIKDIYEAWGARIKSNVFGSIILAFIAVNWKVLYFIVFADVRVETKFNYFDVNTGLFSLIVFPVAIGLVLALFLPFANQFAHRLVTIPIDKMKTRDVALTVKRSYEKKIFEGREEAKWKKIAKESEYDSAVKDAEIAEAKARQEAASNQFIDLTNKYVKLSDDSGRQLKDLNAQLEQSEHLRRQFRTDMMSVMTNTNELRSLVTGDNLTLLRFLMPRDECAADISELVDWALKNQLFLRPSLFEDDSSEDTRRVNAESAIMSGISLLQRLVLLEFDPEVGDDRVRLTPSGLYFAKHGAVTK